MSGYPTQPTPGSGKPVQVTNGVTDLNSGLLLDGIPFDVIGTAPGDIVYNNGFDWVNLPIGTTGQFLQVIAGLPAWGAGGGGGGGVTSLNGLTGALSGTTPNGSMSIGTNGADVTFDINLAHSQTWASLQYFPSTDLIVLGSSTGGTELASAEAGAGSHVQMFPAKTGTVADTSDVPMVALTVTGPDAPGAPAVVGTGTTWTPADHDHGLPKFKGIIGGTISNNVTTTSEFYPPYANSPNASNKNALVVPYAVTYKNLNVNIITDALSNAHTWSLTVHISSTPGTFADSSITTGPITGGTTGIVSDTTHFYSAAANYLICVEFVANAGSTSSSVVCEWSLELDQI